MATWVVLAFAVAAVAALGVYSRRAANAERAARRHMASLNARFEDIFERTTDLIVVHDRRGRVTTMNRTAEHASGYAREEARTIDASWLFNKDYTDTIERMIAEGADALPRTIRAELITKRTVRIPIEADARLLVTDKQVAGVTVVARNVAEREQREAELRHAQKMEAVGRLATGIAHDFNNLITVLIGYTDELLERVERSSPLRRPVEEVRRAVDRAAGLTQQLLTFSRRQAATLQRLDLNATVSNMRPLLTRLVGAEITLAVTLDRHLGLVEADPVQIGQVVMNLVVNARDAMPGGGTLSIRTANVELGPEHLEAIPGPHVMLEVQDSGVGMTHDIQRQLFEPFFTTKTSGEGTGLGLSMVNTIVRQCGGHVALESEPGKGSTFRIYLPRIADHADLPADASATADLTDVRRVAAKGSGVVLIAEDDRAVRRLMSEDLRRRGFTVLEARHGGEALEICKQHDGAIDILVTDVVMPTMNGVDLVAAARPLRPDMAVLFMSGHPERAGVGLEASGHSEANLLLKPFSPDTLATRINEMIRASRSL